MATSREYFALDWIKGELLETLNKAREGLEAFAEALENGEASFSPAATGSLRACVIGLHQVHGTLVMLELEGVTLLADHLERIAERLMNSEVGDVAGACQILMQGILELPGYLDELQSGVPDSKDSVLSLVNDLRKHLEEPPLEKDAGIRLQGVADEVALARFRAIEGVDKTRKVRVVYQQVLLGLLKGGDVGRAVETLRKVAQGMVKVCDGTPHAGQWQAFGEFVESLALRSDTESPLPGEAVKLLRRVDSEIREVAQSGAKALQRPVSVSLVRQLVEAAAERGRRSAVLDDLRRAVSQGEHADSLSLSGRQALVSAASALRDELGTVKDRLDLFVRGGGEAVDLKDLLPRLKQIGSTLSLLGFESSRTIVLAQVEALAALVESGRADEAGILNVAGALVQVDENLASLTQGGKGEVEKITDEAQRAVAQQARQGLERVKQSIVDYVSSQWDVRHLHETPAELDSIVGALKIIPLSQAADLVQRSTDYIRQDLMVGHTPSWEELDRLADALSGIDYYLERLASENPAGAEEVLEFVRRSLDRLAVTPRAETPVAAAGAEAPQEEAAAAADTAEAGPAAAEPEPAVTDAPVDDSRSAGSDPLFGSAEEVDLSTPGDAGDEDEPRLALETDEDFDLGSELFDEIPGSAADARGRAAQPQSREAASTEPAPGSAMPDDVADDGAAPASGPDVATATGPPPRPPRAATPPPSLVDSFESDEEIIEIFVEEVEEVLDAVDEHLSAWAGDLEDESHQSEIRRAFHTLKGSGRMVGANVLGEMAWSVENMLNRVLDGTVQPTPEFVIVVRQARELTPRLTETFEQKGAPDMAPVAQVMERADILASGGSLDDASETGAAPAYAAPQPGEGTAGLDDDGRLFTDEAVAHVKSLRAACRDGGFVLEDDVMRALHTLSGSAAMAGLSALGELAAPAYELARALKRPGGTTPLAGEQAAFFVRMTETMAAMLADMQAGREPEEGFQLVADADHLLMQVPEPGATGSRLLGLPAVAVLDRAGDLLSGWKEGAMDLALADDLKEALTEFERVAHDEGQQAIEQLCTALLGAHERFEFEKLPDDGFRALRHGHDALLDQLDALAADQSPAADPAVIGALQTAGSTPGTPTASAVGAPSAGSRDLEEDEIVLEPVSVPDETAAGREFGLDLEAEALPDHQTAPGGKVPAVEAPARRTPGDRTATDATTAREDERIELPDDDDLELPEVVELDEPAFDGAVAGTAHDDSLEGAALRPEDAKLIPEEVDEEIIGVFFEEADEILEALDTGISQWSDEPENRLHLENLLRGLHTLKGGARLSGLVRLGDVTHDFESFLIDFQDSARPAEDVLFDALHGRHDELAALLARIKALLAGESPSPAAHREQTPPPAPPRLETPPPPVAERPAEPVPPEVPAAAPAPVEAALADTAPRDNVAPLRPSGPKAPEREAAEARPETAGRQAAAAQEMVRVGAGLLENLVNLAGESSIIRARVEQGMSDFTGSLEEMETTIDRLREQLRRLEIETEAQILFRQERTDGPSYEDFDPLEMDRYSQLQQLSRALGESASDMLDLKDTLLYKAREAETLLLQQARVNTELQEGLMRSRMVPFSRLVPRLKRTVRQVAKELDKDVELHAHNVEGELDRTLLERMVPPLEHMLRNAVDHGIEKRDQRRAHGKSEAGRIDLRLSREGGDVVIEIADDGAGIDVDRVRAKAVERGLMAADANLKDEEISQFVFAPGFSTAAAVTQISGRGVGMDVVASEVKQLGGSIDIVSERGQGTRFVVRVPFTVSVNRALMVSVGEDLYAIPLNTIEGIVLLAPEELERLHAPEGKSFQYAGVAYRVQYLGSFLGREYHAQPLKSSVPVVLVRSGEQAVAVHVDSVQGSREIVVKSLGPQFAGVGGISGATILGDGSVVVILDLLALIRSQAGASQSSGRRGVARAARTRCVMVVDDSVTVRKVTSRVLERQGMDVIVAKDGVEAVSLLQERRPDVMLLDIEMPRMDGFEVLRQVRHDERLKDLPIVMISSRTGSKHQDRAAELGVNRFLGKPFQESELLATIDELVN